MNRYPDPGFTIKIKHLGLPLLGRASVAVAIPARNEEERIVPCLAALAAQSNVANEKIAVIVLLNNCTDGTLTAIEANAANCPFAIVAASVELPRQYANAGWARRLAMQEAASRLDDDGLLLTTDADSVAFPDWIAQTRMEFDSREVDAVAGFVTADWNELSQFPEDVLAQGALEWEYQGLAAELEAKADPLAHDPWPRHNQNCGASLSIKAGLYRKLGGLPPEQVGEDRALCEAVRLADGKVRHSLAVHVTASARTVGRASGGMADALRTRGTDSYLCDDILEPAVETLRRNSWRAQARAAWNAGGLDQWLQAKSMRALPGRLGVGTFGQAWASIENNEPALQRKRLRSADLPQEIRRIKRLLRQIDQAALLARLSNQHHLNPGEATSLALTG